MIGLAPTLTVPEPPFEHFTMKPPPLKSDPTTLTRVYRLETNVEICWLC